VFKFEEYKQESSVVAGGKMNLLSTGYTAFYPRSKQQSENLKSYIQRSFSSNLNSAYNLKYDVISHISWLPKISSNAKENRTLLIRYVGFT
jgi:hypothetical protein